MKPIISIIMPVYNAEKFLHESIEDVLHQTEKNIELICVDDGSTDHSADVIEKYCQKDKRVRLIRQENRGGGAARNRGMDAASGEYLLFLDADDRFSDQLVGDTYSEAKRLQADVMVFGGDLFEYESGKQRPHTELLNAGVLSEESQLSHIISADDKKYRLFRFTNTTAWNKLFRADLIENLHLQFQENYGADVAFFTMIALYEADRIGYLDREYVHYRLGNPTGQLRNVDKNPMCAIDAMLSVKNRLMEDKCYDDHEAGFVPYACDWIVRRFRMLGGYEGKKQVYQLLRSKVIDELKLSSNMIDGTPAGRWRELLDEIKKYSFEEYLFVENQRKGNVKFGQAQYLFPQDDIKGNRIALYGAGKVGQSYFIQILNSERYKLATWVDKRYAVLEYPIQSIEHLKDINYDLVIIAIENQDVAEEIKRDLIASGVPIAKIFWKAPMVK